MTAKTTTNRNCPIPNEGGFGPAGSVVFNELAIDLILTTSVNFGAVRQGANCCNIAIALILSYEKGCQVKKLLPAPLRDAGVVTYIQPHLIPHLILRGVIGLVALARRTSSR